MRKFEDTSSEIEEILSSTVLLGGKKIRSKIIDYFAAALNISKCDALILEGLVESTHAATLCHDDVIDESLTRRNRPSLNAIVGNKLAVLAGDVLLSDIISRTVELKNTVILCHLSDVIKNLSEGEWFQLRIEKDGINPDWNDVLEIAKCKTGALFGLSSAISFEFINHPQIAAARRFGEYLGVGFQLIDDCLDCEEDDGTFNAVKNLMHADSTLTASEAQEEVKRVADAYFEQAREEFLKLNVGDVKFTEGLISKLKTRTF